MKLVPVFIFITFSLAAQDTVYNTTQVELSVGMSSVYLNKGVELMRSESLRKNKLSYYQNSLGQRKQVGEYSSLIGLTMKIGFYKPMKKLKGLMVGLNVRNSMTGSEPNEGYSEAYFFNFISGNISAKYYCFSQYNVYVGAEIGQQAVFTKNRFVDENNNQMFLHQFGTGFSGGFNIGYSLKPIMKKKLSIDIQIHYQFANTRVEVNDIGDDHWKFNSLHFTAGITL